MNNVQLYFAIGIPTFSVLVGIMVGIFQSNHVLNQLNLWFTSHEYTMNLRFASMESKMQVLENSMKMLARLHNDMDVRLARLEERLTR